MKEKINPKDRIGQRRKNISGLWMEVVEYRNSKDITVRFDVNDFVVKHASWSNFKNGAIANKAATPTKNRDTRLGETRVMNNGLKATVIEYKNSKNISVRFQDGEVVHERTYNKFTTGEIGHPTIVFQNSLSVPEFAINYYLKHLGFKKIKSGEWKDKGFGDYELDFYHEEKMFAIEYDGAIHNRESSKKNEAIKNSLCHGMGIKLYRIRDPYLKGDAPFGSTNYMLKKSDFVDHRLLDCKQALEEILTNNGISFDQDMIDFRRDAKDILQEYEETCVLAHARDRIGEVVFSTTANQNMRIVAYHNSHDVDVEFEDDGAVRKGIYYTQFLAGTVSHPDQLSVNYEDVRVGETKTMRNGLVAKICAYRTNKDIDVAFLDGRVVEHINYNAFKKGRVGHPDYDTNFLINRNKKLGMVGVIKSGEHVKIVEYRSGVDMDILFIESNELVEHVSFAKFERLTSDKESKRNKKKKETE